MAFKDVANYPSNWLIENVYLVCALLMLQCHAGTWWWRRRYSSHLVGTTHELQLQRRRSIDFRAGGRVPAQLSNRKLKCRGLLIRIRTFASGRRVQRFCVSSYQSVGNFPDFFEPVGGIANVGILQEDGYSEQRSRDFEDVVTFRLVAGAPGDCGTLQVDAVIYGRQMLIPDLQNIFTSLWQIMFFRSIYDLIKKKFIAVQ